MLLLLDTTTPTALLTIVRGDEHIDKQWQAERGLAKGLLGWVRDCLASEDATFEDIQAIGVKRGPGSFTGIRIGMTVMNTMAQSLQIPIVGATGESWSDDVLRRLESGQSDAIVLPYYDREALITRPRK